MKKTYGATGRAEFLRKLSRRHGPQAAMEFVFKRGLNLRQVDQLVRRRVISTNTLVRR